MTKRLRRCGVAALQVGEGALTHCRILRRAIPEAERVFAPGGVDAERHDDAVLADVTPSTRTPRDQAVRAVDRQAASCAAVFTTNAAHGALAGPAADIVAGSGSRLRAYWRVAHPQASARPRRRFTDPRWPSLESGNALPRRSHARAADEAHLSAPARPRSGRCQLRGLSLHLMLIALTADRRPTSSSIVCRTFSRGDASSIMFLLKSPFFAALMLRPRWIRS